jgi:DNA-binding LytR/AlgR family response regulator
MRLVKLQASWCRLYTEEEREQQRILGKEDVHCDPINRELGPVIIDVDDISRLNSHDGITNVVFKGGDSIMISMPLKKFETMLVSLGIIVNTDFYKVGEP